MGRRVSRRVGHARCDQKQQSPYDGKSNGILGTSSKLGFIEYSLPELGVCDNL